MTEPSKNPERKIKMTITETLDKIAKHFKCHHHVNYNIHTINAFDKDRLEGAIVCVNTSENKIVCSEIRRSLNGYFYTEVLQHEG